MSTIHLVEPGGQPAAYEEAQARALWAQGSVSPRTHYWQAGMAQWRPAAEFFGPPPASSPAARPLPATRLAPVVYTEAKDPTALTNFLIVMIWLSLGAAAGAALTESFSLATGNAAKGTEGEFTLCDLVETVMGLFQMAVFIATSIPFLMWIWRANANARALGAEGLSFTPGWSVGWFFVPILNLWYPYQVMKEIWQASRNPAAWSTEPVPALLGWWWGLWLLTNSLGMAALRFSLHPENPVTSQLSTVLGLLSDLAFIALCPVAVRLVRTIFSRQIDRLRHPGQATTAVLG